MQYQRICFQQKVVTFVILVLVVSMLVLTGFKLAHAAEDTEHPIELIMFTEEGCAYCQQWEEEIGGIYPKTTEAERAPLRRIDLDYTKEPEGLELARMPMFTPTFIVVHKGKEVGRIEGYPGDHWFFPLLNTLIEKAEKIEQAATQ